MYASQGFALQLSAPGSSPPARGYARAPTSAPTFVRWKATGAERPSPAPPEEAAPPPSARARRQRFACVDQMGSQGGPQLNQNRLILAPALRAPTAGGMLPPCTPLHGRRGRAAPKPPASRRGVPPLHPCSLAGRCAPAPPLTGGGSRPRPPRSPCGRLHQNNGCGKALALRLTYPLKTYPQTRQT